MSRELKFFKFVLILMFAMGCVLKAQVSDVVSSVKLGEAKEGESLSISAELRSPSDVSSIYLAYKPFGETDFIKLEMMVAGNTATVTIPEKVVVPPYLEYYFVIELRDGTSQTYPLGVESGVSPLQVAVGSFSEKDKEIIFLSPVRGEVLTPEDMLISISFMKAPSNVDPAKTKIFIDGQDVSQYAVFTGDLVILTADNLPEAMSFGSKVVKIEVYDNSGALYHTISHSFLLASAEMVKSIADAWKFRGNLRGESRNESYNEVSTWYNNVSADVSASYSDWQLNGYAYLTSEEKTNLQPFNRFSASIKSGDWLDFSVGDAYPRFSSIVMEGKRIRGFTGAINLGFFNVQATFGQSERAVKGELLEKFTADNVPLGSNIIAINESKYGFPYGRVNLGTFKRDIFAVRPSFGSGENFQWGFTYLHGKDDPNSIEFGARPQENALFGTDMKIAFDDQNFMLTGQAAVSLYNKDISTGTLTDAQIDEVFGPGSYFDGDPQTIKDIKNILGKFITVNQYIGPLNPQEFSSLAAEGALNLNYLNNNLKASYIYRGNDYQSFGQTFLRTDVKGINFIDRIRMFDNKVFLSLGYENLQDNLQKTKIATTTYKTLSASLSIFPRADFPNITFGINRYENNNGLKSSDSENGKYSIDDNTNRFLLQLSYDLTAGIRHSTSLAFTTSTRDDNGMTNADAKYSTASFSLSSYWDQKLTSFFNFVYYTSEITTIKFDYITLSVGGRYKMLEDKLLLSASLSPSFGDFKRQALDFSADYNILANLNLIFQARLYKIPDKSTNSIVGLTTRLAI